MPFLFISIAVLLFVVALIIYNGIYANFALINSVAIKNLQRINEQYNFFGIEPIILKNSYDNENFYGDISCQDYLIYNLQFLKRKAEKAMREVAENNRLLSLYDKEITKSCNLNDFGEVKLPRNQRKLEKITKKLFNKKLLSPCTDFEANVYLELTNINGRHQSGKAKTFNCQEIRDIINKLNEKDGAFYRNRDVWDAICRVERGKVSNKMRFAIYARDGYRCRKCKRKTNDLEVDHIYPIAKGGKTTFDNLQTLCHRCNARKSDNIE